MSSQEEKQNRRNKMRRDKSSRFNKKEKRQDQPYSRQKIYHYEDYKEAA